MNLQAFKTAIESKGHISKLKYGYLVYRCVKINNDVLNKNNLENDKNNFDDIDFIGDN